MTMDQCSPRSVDVAETAKCVKKCLAVAFPAVKFSIRSYRYSGGASVEIGWTDGPTEPEVWKLTDGFAGTKFDSLIDMAHRVSSWLLPDGTAQPASSLGTVRCQGSHEPYSYPSPHPDAQIVTFSGYVNTSRRISEKLLRYGLAWYLAGHPGSAVRIVGSVQTRRGVTAPYLEGDIEAESEIYAFVCGINTELVSIELEVVR